MKDLNFLLPKKKALILYLSLLFSLLLNSCTEEMSTGKNISPITTIENSLSTPEFLPTETPNLNLFENSGGTVTSTPFIAATPTQDSNAPTEAAEEISDKLPEEFYIENIYGFRQAYQISCESRSAADWANYFGVFAYEANIQFALPISDNPDFGFVGDVHDPWGQVPPYSYGVHAEPIANVLRQDYDLPAQSAKGFSLEQLKHEIASGQPVIAWVIGNVVGGVPAEYTDSKGNKTIVAAYEHTIIVTGYNDDQIRYLNNGRFYDVPEDVFLNSWGVLGNMVVFYDDSLIEE